MKTIEYKWDINTIQNEIDQVIDQPSKGQLPSRKSFQIARRVFHMSNGVIIASIYLMALSHAQMIHLLGTIACVIYVVEQLRINYPEISGKMLPLTRFVMRAEEQLKESSMIPYLIAVLLTIITFPKPIALIGIYTLAIADPLSALVGIKYGKHRIVPHKSLEGSLAFFVATFFCSLFVLSISFHGPSFTILFVSILIAFLTSIFEMLPIKLDDNLTIPLFTSFTLWILCEVFGLYV